MAVGQDYMLHKPDAASAPKLFFDTHVVPVLINAAGAAEVALDRAAVRLRVRPSTLLGAAGATLGLGLWAVARRRRRAGHGPSAAISSARA